MNCSPKNSVHPGASLRGQSREQSRGAEAVVSAQITSRKRKRGGFAPTVSCFRTIRLAAFVLAIVSSGASADITLNSRLSSAGAAASAGSDLDSPPAKSQTNFLPANLSNSATASEGDASANATSSLVSDITLDALADTLRLTGNCTVTGDAIFGPTMSTAASCASSARALSLSFTLTGEHTYTLTGQVSATLDNGSYGATGRANLTTSSSTIFDVSATTTGGGSESKPLSESGTLPPGTYTLDVTAGGNGLAESSFFPHSKGSSSANFVFTVLPAGAPTPTPTPTPTPPVIQWNNSAGGAFHTASNWDPQQVPSENDDAVFDVPGTYTVSLDGSASHNALFGSGTGVNVTFDLGGNTYTLNQLQTGGLAGEDASFTFSGVFEPASIASGPAGFAPQGAGGLVQVNQTLVVGDGAMQAYVEQARVSANQVSVEGLLRVKDPGSLLETDSLQVGIFGNDPEFFVDEGQVVSAHATVGSSAFVRVGRGTVLQTPDPSHWEIADELDVTDDALVGFSGGSVNVGGRCVVGDSPTAFSDLFVKGLAGGPAVGATFSVSEVIVGRNGKGTMEVDELGLAQIGSLEIGNDPDNSGGIGDGTVRVLDGGTLLVSNDLTVGGSGLGLLTIEGGVLSQDGPDAQMEVNQDGDVFFSGGTGNLSFVDVNPGGTFLVTSSVVNAHNMLMFGGEVGADADGVLNISSGLVVSGPGTLQVGSTGQVNIGEGSGINGKVRVGPNGILSGDGTIVATEIVTAGSGNNQFTGGQTSPGNSPGTLTLQGNLMQEFGSSLVMEIAGLAEGEFDVLHVTGDATFGGTLEMVFPGEYLPKTGDSFQFLQVDGTISGDFAEVTFPQLLPGFLFDMTQVSSGLLFTALNDAVLAPTFMLNISTRLQVGTDDNVLIGGFILLGTEPKRVLIRAIGPSLGAAGVSGALADPTLELHDSTGAVVGQNDNWRTTQTGGVIAGEQFAQIYTTGIPPTNNAESAIIATLDPGAYTAILAGANSSTGIGLVEVYDLGPANASGEAGQHQHARLRPDGRRCHDWRPYHRQPNQRGAGARDWAVAHRAGRGRSLGRSHARAARCQWRPARFQ